MAASRRVLRKLALALAVLFGALLLLELGARAYLRMRGAPYDGARARAELLEIQSRLVDDLPLPAHAQDRAGRHRGSREVLHPYLGFENTSGPPAFARELRNAGRPQPRPGRFRVLILGGSVGAIFHQLGDERLAELLQADPRLAGREVVFGTLARAAFKQPQSYLYLSWALSMGVRPDAVLLLDGFNEVSMGYANAKRGMHPAFPSYNQWMSLAQSASTDEGLLERWFELRQRKQALTQATETALGAPVFQSALLGHLLRRWVLGREARYSEATAGYLDALAEAEVEPTLLGPPFEGSAADATRLAADNWFECSRLTQALCESLEIPFLHVLQPTLFDPGAKKPRSAEEEAIASKPPGWLAGVEQGYPLLRELGARLSAEGVAFLDASALFAEVEETQYYDVCHFGEDGNRRLAERIAPALLELLEQPR